MMRDFGGRFIFIKIILVILAGVLIARLYSMQIANGEGYLELANSRHTSAVTDKAPRGTILDRYGKNLVTNRVGYSLQLLKTAKSDEDTNKMLADLVELLEGFDTKISDTLPVSDFPYQFTFSDDEEKQEWFDSKKKLNIGMSAEEVMDYYAENEFDVSGEYSEYIRRRIIGIRYDAAMNGFSFSVPFTVAEDVDMAVVTAIKERSEDFADIAVTKDYFRQYEFGSLAAHTIGRVGKIYREEYEELEGYSLNSMIGKQGIEKLCEEYLKGIDGVKVLNKDVDSDLINVDDTEAESGAFVVLTIDSDLQQVAETALKTRIEEIAANGEGKGLQKGADANAGAAVVIDVNTGEILALANYPSYNPETFNSEYSKLLEDGAKPLLNRAVAGIYSPGSIFKPLTAIAALETGAITVDERLPCDGVYRFFKGYSPKCWIYGDYGTTHGHLNVTEAIAESCNCFFYETGRRAGIDAINRYAKLYGLGESTGIELSEETKGYVANPQQKERVEGEGQQWYGGDTIQAAIGQSYSQFTPIQLANYIGTIANGGNRYRLKLIKRIQSSQDGTILYESKPEVEEKITLSNTTLSAVKKGMYGVVDEGSASSVFDKYPVEIGGKTGTAQVGTKSSNTALFCAFAPYDDPEIAICIVIEHGVRGYNAAYAAKDILDEYFGLNEAAVEKVPQGELLP